MAEYIDRDALIKQMRTYCEVCERRKGKKDGRIRFIYEIGEAPCRACYIDDMVDSIEGFPAADVVSRDEGIRMGAELAAMHGSDATSQQLEKAFFDGMEEAMKKKDVRPVVRGEWGYRWKIHGDGRRPRELFPCSECGYENTSATNFCPNCGADMREPPKEE